MPFQEHFHRLKNARIRETFEPSGQFDSDPSLPEDLIMNAAGTFHSLFIGISEYHTSLGRVSFAADDSQWIAKVIAARTGSTPVLLVDGGVEDCRPTGRRVQMQLAGLIAQATPQDTLLVYFAGHITEAGGKPYLVMADSTLQNLHNTGLSLGKICDSLERADAGQKILILDAWRAVPGRPAASLTRSTIHELENSAGIYGITSCDEGQHALDWKEKKQGLFAWYFVEALSDEYEPKQGHEQTLNDLFEWTRDHVTSWAATKTTVQVPRQYFDGSSAPALPARGSHGPGLVECPSCGRHNPVAQTFECLLCRRKHLCASHEAHDFFGCVECEMNSSNRPAQATPTAATNPSESGTSPRKAPPQSRARPMDAADRLNKEARERLDSLDDYGAGD